MASAPGLRLPLRAPSLSLRALESLAMVETSMAVPSLPLLGLTGRGDGHPVLVLPGFTASDRSTWWLRNVLRAKGYAVAGWGLGANVGPHPRIVRGLHRRLLEVQRRHERRVSLVGWSLGGIYARELARALPEHVRLVVSLGSPFRLREADSSAAQGLYRQVGPRVDPFPGRRAEEYRRDPLPVPTTSIYTRTDGIVRWHACIDTVGPRAENIEVRGTHTGLGVNIGALIAVTDRLAQPEETWAPFAPPLLVRHLFPLPVSWEPR